MAAPTPTVDEWATQAEIDDVTKQLLVDNGFISMKSIKLLTPHLIQKHFQKSLSLSQALLLNEAITTLNSGRTTGRSASATPPSTTDDSTPAGSSSAPANNNVEQQGASSSGKPDLDMASVWQILDNTTNNQPTDKQQSSAGKPHVFDPFSFDSVSSDSSKCRDVKDYVTLLHETNKNKQTLNLGGVELSIPETKPKLESISPLQYMEASQKILREMVFKDGADLETVMEYTGYVIKIATMGQRFNWQSVLKYDSEYRRYQATNKFKWGADNAFTMMVFLKDSMSKDQASQFQQPQRRPFQNRLRTKYDSASGRIVCEKFNGRNGCSLTACKYAHVCSTCFSATHNEFTHRSRPNFTAPR